MNKADIDVIRALTIGQAQETFNADYGDFPDYDNDKNDAEKNLHGYIEGVNDVLNILEKNFLEHEESEDK